jgi:excisionase family DNA binding protein
MSWQNKTKTTAKTAERRYVSLTAAAEYADVSTKTLRRWIAESRVPGYRAGRLIKVDLNELDAALRPMAGGGAS